jgi:hypothetical protein
MNSTTMTATIIRMIFTALLPDLTGAAAGVAAAEPHDLQNCSFSGKAEPHLGQKLAMMISLSYESVRDSDAFPATRHYISTCSRLDGFFATVF